MGQLPLRIDLLLTIPGVDFERAWPRRHDVRWGDVEVHVLGFDDLLASKRASGRPHDLRDAEALEKTARTT